MGPAEFGLCTAWAAHQRGDGVGASPSIAEASTTMPVPFANLAAAAAARSQTVEDLCAGATPGAGDPTDAGEAASTTTPGHSGDTPAVTAPGHRGDTPAATARARHDTPAVSAPAKSGNGHGHGHG
jgi:hypothetical protein